ncbi:MAG: sugar ABC transporter substrate-binding protein [Christensenellaceae bacterium]
MKKVLVLALVVVFVAMATIACAPAPAAPVATEAPADAATQAPAASEAPAAAAGETKMGEYTFKIDPTKSPADLEIAVVYMNTTAPFAQGIKQGVDAGAKEFGVNAYLTGKETWDTAAEIDVVQNLITKGVDGIAVAVMDEPGMTPIIQEALKAGIPTITFNVDAPESGRLGFVGENLADAGAATAKDVAEAMGGKGKVLISSVAQSSTWSRQRQDGVESVLEGYPDIEVVQIVDCPGSEQDQYGVLENALLANPDINGHISLGGTAYVFARVLKQNNMGNITSDKPIFTSGHDLTPADEVLGQIKDGWLLSMYTQVPYQQGYESVKMLTDFLTTGNTDSFYVLDSKIESVTAKNVDEYLKKLEAGEPVG